MKITKEELAKIVEEELQKEGLFDFFRSKKKEPEAPTPEMEPEGPSEEDLARDQEEAEKAYKDALIRAANMMKQSKWQDVPFRPHPKLNKLIGHTWFTDAIEKNRTRPWMGNFAAWEKTLEKTFPMSNKKAIEYLDFLSDSAEKSGLLSYRPPEPKRRDRDDLYTDIYGSEHDGGRLASLSSMEESKTNDTMASLMENWRSFEKKTLLSEKAPAQGSLGLDTGPTTQQKGAAVLSKRVKDASQQKVVPMVKFLNSPEGKDPKVRAALSQGTKDGKRGDEVIPVDEEAQPSVGELFPTQNEISLAKSIGWPLSSTDTLSNVASGDPTGKGMKVVTAGNLVIDGHHRWSSVFSVNPKGAVLAIDITLPGDTPLAKLAVAQTAIAATIDPRSGDVPKATTDKGDDGGGDNILGKKPDEIAAMIKQLIGTPHESGGKILGDQYIAAAKKSREGAKYFGLKPEMDDNQARATIIDRVAKNLAALPKPQGPVRDYMPQFDGGDTHKGQIKTAQVLKKMKSGGVNYKAPFEESKKK